MIIELSHKNIDIIYTVINRAATVYKGVIPDDRYNEPYMPIHEVEAEMKSMTFYGWKEKGQVVGVMGFQPIEDVTLIRHTYVLPGYQRRGIGTRLLDHAKRLTKTKYLLVGTWTSASWAIDFYRKRGFRLMPDKDKLLKRYWDIPQRQIDTSVVLGISI